jgi:hypothetical protein
LSEREEFYNCPDPRDRRFYATSHPRRTPLLSEWEEFYDYPDPRHRRFYATSYPRRTPLLSEREEFYDYPDLRDRCFYATSKPQKVVFSNGALPLEQICFGTGEAKISAHKSS